MIKVTHIGAGSSLIAAMCLFLGYVVSFIIVPDFVGNSDTRADSIRQHALLIQAYYFVVWIVFAGAVLLSNYALLYDEKRPHNIYESLITLSCFVAVCYFVSIGLIEISSTFIVTNDVNTLSQSNEFREYFTFLQKFRGSTEFAGDVWLILINSYLFKMKTTYRVLAIWGGLVGVLGMILLHPAFYSIANLYLILFVGWFFCIGLRMLK
ncbi:hypothetical protein [Paraglaciecola arctica]|uniref:hypothetical protein n=1 Tax=Paraglaciecola arctica TaxID=1128911 RepID=UPI001C067DBA|nr:hypothetical protein [Paraglaciecola arctica]MBU3002166.1 hypothetical protein [Paraglaciecola arctica]